MNSNQHVIIQLKSGTKCEGILVSIDKERMLIKLLNAKRISISEDGKYTEESFPDLEIAKEEIKEVKIVQFEPQDAKKPENGQGTSINAIPQNFQSNALRNQNTVKTYDKTDSFFDALKPMTNTDAQYDSMRYNDKNCETFDLPKGTENVGNYDNRSSFGNRRGGFGRGGNRGGYRGGYHNYHNNNYNNNNYNKNQGQNPSGSYYEVSQSGQGNQRQNQNFRGGRGGFNNNNNYNQRRNNYNNNNMGFPNDPNINNINNCNDNYSNQFQKQSEMFGANSDSGFSISAGQIDQNPNFDNFNSNNGYRGNSGNFRGFERGRGGNSSRGFGSNNYRGRGENRFKNNRIPNPEFNNINENNDDQLDDDYNMSIYDKPSTSETFASQKPQTQCLSAYDPNTGKDDKSIYDK